MSTNVRTALARGGQPANSPPTRLPASTVDSASRCHATYSAVLPFNSPIRKGLVHLMGDSAYGLTRRGERHSALARLDQEMCDLVAAGAGVRELVRLEAHVAETRARLVGADTLRSVDVLDQEDAETDAAEQLAETRRRCGARVTPAALRAEAEANRQQAAVSVEKAIALDLWAKRLEREQLRAPAPQPPRAA